MHRTTFGTILAVGLLASTAASASVFTIFTDRNTFESTLNGLAVYDFGTGAPASGVTITGGNVSYVNGRMRDQINLGAATDTVFSFASSIVGFGGDFNLAVPGGEGTGISIETVNGGPFSVGTEMPNSTNGFWGFISSMAFTTVNFSEGTQLVGVERYTLDNLTTGASVVPLPAAGWMLIAGLGGIAALRRRKKAA